MENYHILFPSGSSSFPSSSLTVANHRSFLQAKDVITSATKVGIISNEYRKNSEGKDDAGDDRSGGDGDQVMKVGKKKGDHKKGTVKKHKFAFQTRSQVDILDDGYRWRKYGQKTVKNSSFPRSYYRCTHKECNVKKQVQRSSKDDGIVVTTYEGIHTHPVERFNENFEHILRQIQTYNPL